MIMRRSPQSPGMLATRALVWTAATLVLAGCSATQTATAAENSPSTETTAPAVSDVHSLDQRGTAASAPNIIVDKLAQQGLSVPNPMDVTSLCQTQGCVQSVVTDTLRITSFSTPDAATSFAEQRNLHHYKNIVVAFPSVLSQKAIDVYWTAIKAMLR